MKQTTFQLPEIRDANDNIIQQGTYGKESPLVNSTNDGVLDYINNNLMYLYNNTMGGTGGEINTETITGKTGTITNLTATTVKAGTVTADALNGPLTGNVTGTADKAVADGDGNNIVNTYVTKSAVQGELTNYLPLSGGTLTGVVNGVTPTAGDNSTKIATTEFVNAKAGNYLPLSGGTLTGVVNGVTPTAGDNSTKIATTEFVNAKAGNYLPLRGGTLTGAINTANNTWNKLGDDASFGDHNIGGKMCIKSQTARKTGIAFFNKTDTNVGEVDVNNAFDFNKPVKENGGFLVPIGVVQAFAGRTTPQGWLLCDGSAVSRTDYAALYAVIGTTYGAGNGSSTFNLPNLVDKFVEGSATAGTVKSAGLPNITGTLSKNGTFFGYFEVFKGAFTPESQSMRHSVLESGGTYNLANGAYFDASRSSSIYGNSTTVQPPALTMRYIIKY